MNPQQRHLLDLLDIARGDLEAGRPAQRTAYALQTQLRAEPYDDFDRGLADDDEWRKTRRTQ